MMVNKCYFLSKLITYIRNESKKSFIKSKLFLKKILYLFPASQPPGFPTSRLPNQPPPSAKTESGAGRLTPHSTFQIFTKKTSSYKILQNFVQKNLTRYPPLQIPRLFLFSPPPLFQSIPLLFQTKKKTTTIQKREIIGGYLFFKKGKKKGGKRRGFVVLCFLFSRLFLKT
jgi:hypothetical protein